MFTSVGGVREQDMRGTLGRVLAVFGGGSHFGVAPRHERESIFLEIPGYFDGNPTGLRGDSQERSGGDRGPAEPSPKEEQVWTAGDTTTCTVFPGAWRQVVVDKEQRVREANEIFGEPEQGLHGKGPVCVRTGEQVELTEQRRRRNGL